MNLRDERENNKQYIKSYDRQGHKVLEVDITKARFQGRKVYEYNSREKKAFEDMLYLSEAPTAGGPLKIILVG